MANNPEDTGWQPITGIEGDGDVNARGRIELATGTEKNPCFSCKSFEQDERRLIEYLQRRGLEPDKRGHFRTPIAKDFPGRKSMVIDPKSFGWCRRDSLVTDMLATCEGWKQKDKAADFK